MAGMHTAPPKKYTLRDARREARTKRVVYAKKNALIPPPAPPSPPMLPHPAKPSPTKPNPTKPKPSQPAKPALALPAPVEWRGSSCYFSSALMMLWCARKTLMPLLKRACGNRCVEVGQQGGPCACCSAAMLLELVAKKGRLNKRAVVMRKDAAKTTTVDALLENLHRRLGMSTRYNTSGDPVEVVSKLYSRIEQKIGGPPLELCVTASEETMSMDGELPYYKNAHTQRRLVRQVECLSDEYRKEFFRSPGSWEDLVREDAETGLPEINLQLIGACHAARKARGTRLESSSESDRRAAWANWRRERALGAKVRSQCGRDWDDDCVYRMVRAAVSTKKVTTTVVTKVHDMLVISSDVVASIEPSSDFGQVLADAFSIMHRVRVRRATAVCEGPYFTHAAYAKRSPGFRPSVRRSRVTRWPESMFVNVQCAQLFARSPGGRCQLLPNTVVRVDKNRRVAYKVEAVCLYTGGHYYTAHNQSDADCWATLDHASGPRATVVVLKPGAPFILRLGARPVLIALTKLSKEDKLDLKQ